MAAYNTADFIGEAFASIVSQKPDCELFFVCVDDGSDPVQSERIKDLFLHAGFEKGHAVLKRLDSNHGLTTAWRECTNYFKECEYTTWLDSDDSYCRDDVFSDVARIADKSSPDCILFKLPEDEGPIDTVEKLASCQRVTLWRKVVKSGIVPSFSGDLRIFNDLVPHFEICDKASSVSYVNRMHVQYRDSPISLCRKRLYGYIDSSRELFRTLSAACRKYNRPFVNSACANAIRRFSVSFSDTYAAGSCECSDGSKTCNVVVPYPSTECISASSFVEELSSLHDTCFLYGNSVSSFIVPCGSDTAFKEINGILTGGLPFTVDVFVVESGVNNGTSSLFALLFDCVNRNLSQTAVFIPPWWKPVRQLDLSRYVNDINGSVISIELAGWPWSECGGYMNYVGRRCPIPGYSAVQSHHMRDNLVFDASVPQIVNSSKFISEFTEYFRQEQEFLKRLNVGTYYGKNDSNMVLVPNDTKPYFTDVLGTNPAYRPLQKETT